MKKSVNQLIEWFEPKEYSVQIDARPGRKTFSGSICIYGNKKRDFVRLHAKNLKFTDWVRVDEYFCEVVNLENDEIELRPQLDRKVREVEEDLVESSQWLEETYKRYDCNTFVSIHFEGEIGENSMHGLYPCYYEIDGQKKELLATQFESHHAREVFPCVDEPAAKAVFRVSIDTDPDLTVLSNMPVAERFPSPSFEYEYDGDRQELPTAIYHFEPTPRMSTYLLALIISDLQKKTARTKDGVEVNVYATPAQSAESMDFALDTAVRSIEFYDEYFGTKYPLPKSDHVALPDFSAGAMENWGLVTYRETALLADKNAAISTKQYIATVIAHELSHMWFGDLVTMQWWNDLWLNESFASLMEHICTNALFPDWNMWSNFETGDVIAALRRDALSGVQSVRQDVNHPDEISTLFDPAIVYAKGERLLKMLRAYIGETAFRDGLRNYFKKHAYLNTTADDLWGALSASSGQNVSELMTPWLTQSGYPVVFASQIGEQVRLCQQRFLSCKDYHEEAIGEYPQNYKLYLGSYKPWETGEDFARCIDMIGENKTAVLITNAWDANWNDEWAAETLGETIKLFAKFGIKSEQLDLKEYFGKTEELAKKLQNIGLVYVFGGNTFVLRRAYARSGFDKILPNLLENGVVYSGFSAGSAILSPSLRGYDLTDDPNIVSPEYDTETIWDGLNLIPFSIEPHYRSNHPEAPTVELGVEYHKKHKMPYQTLRDGEAIIVHDGKIIKQALNDENFVYPIMLFANDPSVPKIMSEREIIFTPQNPDNIQLNVSNNAHFIIAYDAKMAQALHDQIPNMSAVDRTKILNELLLLVQPGLQPTAAILDLLPAYKNETNDAVWDIITLALSTIGRFVESDSDDEKRLKKLAGNLAQEQYKRLGWAVKKSESVNDQKLRPTVISQMIYAENRAVIDRALKIYMKHKHDLVKINGDLRPTILTVAVRYGGADEFAYLLDVYKTSQDADLKQDVCSALTSTHDQEQIDKILDFMNKVDIVKPQDLPHWFAWMLGNRQARSKTWLWMRENWSWVEKTFGGDKSYDMFPRYAGARLSTRAELTEFDEFFADKIGDMSLKRAIEVGHNDITARVEWLERDRDAVLSKLEEVVK